MKFTKKKLIIFMPSMEGGGVEKNLILITNYLAKYIPNITLITFDNRFNFFFKKKIRIINSKFQSNKKYSKYFKYLICIILLIKELFKEEKNVVFSFQANIYCCLLSIFFKFDLIVRSNTSPSGWNKNFLKNYIFRIFLSRAKFIIVNSTDFKKELDRTFKIKSMVIYNPLNVLQIKKLSKEKLVEKIYNKKTIRIINIARFTDQKDHTTLLKAFKEARKKIDCELLIMGYGSNKFEMNKFLKENKLSNFVKILDFKNNPYKYLAKADMFILTSIYEGLPNVLLESMALKKLTISTNCPTGPREILGNGKYGILFNMKDYMGLSEIICNYKKKKLNHNKVINEAYRSLKRFDFETNSRKYLEIVNRLI